MGLFNLFDNVGVIKKTENCTAITMGIVMGVSAIQVNKMHLPLVEYEVDNKKYKIRMSYKLAKKMEKETNADYKIVRANLNYGNNFKGQLTKLQGLKVKVAYNPINPKEAVVIE